RPRTRARVLPRRKPPHLIAPRFQRVTPGAGCSSHRAVHAPAPADASRREKLVSKTLLPSPVYSFTQSIGLLPETHDRDGEHRRLHVSSARGETPPGLSPRAFPETSRFPPWGRRCSASPTSLKTQSIRESSSPLSSCIALGTTRSAQPSPPLPCRGKALPSKPPRELHRIRGLLVLLAARSQPPECELGDDQAPENHLRH